MRCTDGRRWQGEDRGTDTTIQTNGKTMTRRGSRTRWAKVVTCGLALTLWLGLEPAGAQMAEEGDDAVAAPTGLEIGAFVGWVSPLSNLTENPDAEFATVVNPYVAFGAEAVYWFSHTLGIGAFGLFAPSELQATQALDPTAPTDLGGANYITAVANVVYRIPVSGTASPVRPYFALGGGIRHLDLDEAQATEAASSTDPVATLAAGVRIPFSAGIALWSELRDVASYYESPITGDSKLQNDIAITVGVGTRIR